MANPDDLRRALAGDKDLGRADLSGADLSGADLSDADLYRTNLRGANLRGAVLTGAVLTGANLTYATLDGATLTYATLIYADLTNANLTRARMTGADLTGAILRDADLTGAVLRGANLRGAVLTGANLRGAIGLPASVAAAVPRRWTPGSSKPQPMDEELTVGLLVNPVSFEIGVGTYEGKYTRVFSLAHVRETIARGWIERDPSEDYSIPAQISGYPRVHSSPGVVGSYQGIKGWGTTIYVCAAAAAELDARSVISLGDGTIGSKSGVCSWNAAEGGRFPDANKWWNKSLERKLSTRKKMCANLPYKGRVCGVIDVMTYRSAVSQNLVAALPSRQELYSPFWDFKRDDRLDSVNKKVLAVVNTGYLAKHPKGLGAMKRLVYMAERAGMTKKQITSMIDRYNAGIDSGEVRFDRSMTKENPSRRGAQRVAPMRPVLYGPRRNPAALSPALERTLEELHDQRTALGYANLADLP